jgi:hypothetical protein
MHTVRIAAIVLFTLTDHAVAETVICKGRFFQVRDGGIVNVDDCWMPPKSASADRVFKACTLGEGCEVKATVTRKNGGDPRIEKVLSVRKLVGFSDGR